MQAPVFTSRGRPKAYRMPYWKNSCLVYKFVLESQRSGSLLHTSSFIVQVLDKKKTVRCMYREWKEEERIDFILCVDEKKKKKNHATLYARRLLPIFRMKTFLFVKYIGKSVFYYWNILKMYARSMKKCKLCVYSYTINHIF